MPILLIVQYCKVFVNDSYTHLINTLYESTAVIYGTWHMIFPSL